MRTTNNTIGKLQSRLSEEEEMTLGLLVQQGDAKALDRLITANIGFVVYVARQYQNHGRSLDDLVSEGNLAMMLAAKKWNPEKGVRFVQYAVWDIRKALAQAVERQGGTVGGKDFSEVSLDAPCKAGGLTTYADRMKSRDDKNANEEAYIASFGYGLMEGIGVLNERERQVIMLYYGIGCDAVTMAEIGEKMSLKRERVRQIRKKAERKLRKPLRELH